MVLFFFVVYLVGRLNIVFVSSVLGDEIDFVLYVFHFPVAHLTAFHQSNINTETSHPQFVENYVFHNVGDFLLTKVQFCVAQTNIDGIVFLDALKILVSLDIEAFGTFEKEGILEVGDVIANGFRVDFRFLYAL